MVTTNAQRFSQKKNKKKKNEKKKKIIATFDDKHFEYKSEGNEKLLIRTYLGNMRDELRICGE